MLRTTHLGLHPGSWGDLAGLVALADPPGQSLRGAIADESFTANFDLLYKAAHPHHSPLTDHHLPSPPLPPADRRQVVQVVLPAG